MGYPSYIQHWPCFSSAWQLDSPPKCLKGSALPSKHTSIEMTPCPGGQESESESVVESEGFVCEHILHVAAGSLHATASAAQEHLQNNKWGFFSLYSAHPGSPAQGYQKKKH